MVIGETRILPFGPSVAARWKEADRLSVSASSLAIAKSPSRMPCQAAGAIGGHSFPTTASDTRRRSPAAFDSARCISPNSSRNRLSFDAAASCFVLNSSASENLPCLRAASPACNRNIQWRVAPVRERARAAAGARRGQERRVSRVGSWECGTERGRRGRILIDAPRANRVRNHMKTKINRKSNKIR